MVGYNISDRIKADQEFHHALGRAMAKWAMIEQRFYFWFSDLTQMTPEMSRAIFYSSKNFAGRVDMVDAAVNTAQVDERYKLFLKAAIKKARQFNSFRNNLAHGEPVFDMYPNSPTFKQTVLVEGKDNLPSPPVGIPVSTLDIATANFGELARLLIDPLMHLQGTYDDDDSSPERCREQIQALPHEADSKRPENPETKG